MNTIKLCIAKWSFIFETFYSGVLEWLTSQHCVEWIEWGKKLEERKLERLWNGKEKLQVPIDRELQI